MDVLKREFGMDCWGIEPSIEAGKGKETIKVGTADNIPFSDDYDVVALAYFLYAADRSDLFKIACEADRVLKDGGYMIVYDFYSLEPRVKENPDCNEILTCKADYGGMFRWHPCYLDVYTKIQNEPHNQKMQPVVVNVFKKQM